MPILIGLVFAVSTFGQVAQISNAEIDAVAGTLSCVFTQSATLQGGVHPSCSDSSVQKEVADISVGTQGVSGTYIAPSGEVTWLFSLNALTMATTYQIAATPTNGPPWPVGVGAFLVPVSSPPVITSSVTAIGTVGTPFVYQITATNGPTAYSAAGLPAALNINTVTGAITGVPSAAGAFSVVISATNSVGTGQAILALTVNPVLVPNLGLVSHTSTSGSGSPVTVTTSAIDTTSASLLILMAADYNQSSAANMHIDSKGNTWTPLQNCATGINNTSGWYVFNPVVGTGHTFTVGGGSYTSVAVMAFSGAASVQSIACKISSGASLPAGPVSTIVPSLLVTWISHAYSNPTVSGGFTVTDFQPYGTFEGISAAYKIQTVAGTENPSWTNNAGQNYSGFLVVAQ